MLLELLLLLEERENAFFYSYLPFKITKSNYNNNYLSQRKY
jgi:hypothetical protein